MRRSIVIVVLVVIVVVAVVAVGVLRGRVYPGLGQGKGSSSVDVRLTMNNGACAVTEPALLGGYYNDEVSWNVQNVNCSAAQYIHITRFQLRLGGGGLGPADPNVIAPDPVPPSPESVATGQSLPLKGRIIRRHFFGDDEVFKYAICIGTEPQNQTNCLDPDFDVWPVF